MARSKDSVLSGTPFDAKVVALDAYNHLATGYTGTVTFSTTDTGKGVVLPADYTFTPDDSGCHIFIDTASWGNYPDYTRGTRPSPSRTRKTIPSLAVPPSQ